MGGEEQSWTTEVFGVTSFPVHRIEAGMGFFARRCRGGHVCELGAGSGAVAASLERANVPLDSYLLTEFSDARLGGLMRRFTTERFQVA